MAGARTRTEPRFRLANGYTDFARHTAIPDARIDTQRGSTLIDFSAICASAKTYVAKAQRQGAAAKFREQAKIDKYNGLAVQEKARFVPFVLEVHGEWGEKAKAFIAFLGEVSEAGHHLSKREFKRLAMHRISLALLRGNASMATRAVATYAGPFHPA
jgi:hypothetical protein